ncbi:MAG TPA: hypothetical protein ENG03_07800 [Thioploca sp.]|nr:MAG: hypothetical protein DRR19_13040 [Gammaproteobacteria bacterium]HDN26983.1 hypothetical protein [Thioploca sp.]
MRLFIVLMAMLFFSKASIAEFDTKACKPILRSTENLLACKLGYSTEGREREVLMKNTYGIIRNLTCITHLNIPKNKVANALLSASEIPLPDHQIDCEIQTNGAQFKIGLTVAPWLQFGDEGVSEVRLNIGKVTGIPAFLGRRLVKYGNGPTLQKEVKEGLNQFIANFCQL